MQDLFTFRKAVSACSGTFVKVHHFVAFAYEFNVHSLAKILRTCKRNSTRAELLEAWLALTRVKHHDNLQVLIQLNQWLALTVLLPTRPCTFSRLKNKRAVTTGKLNSVLTAKSVWVYTKMFKETELLKNENERNRSARTVHFSS